MRHIVLLIYGVVKRNKRINFFTISMVARIQRRGEPGSCGRAGVLRVLLWAPLVTLANRAREDEPHAYVARGLPSNGHSDSPPLMQ